MYLPQVCYEVSNMAHHLIARESTIIELAFLLQIILYCLFQFKCVTITDSVSPQDPFTFAYFVISYLACILIYSIKYLSMHLCISEVGKVERFGTKQFHYVSTYPILAFLFSV